MLPIGLWPRHGWRVSTGFFESPKVEDVKDIAILCNFSSHGCVLHCSRWLRLLHPGCWCRSAVRCSYSMVSFHQLILKGGAPAHQNVLGVSVRTLGSSWMALILWAFVGWQKKTLKTSLSAVAYFFQKYFCGWNVDFGFWCFWWLFASFWQKKRTMDFLRGPRIFSGQNAKCRKNASKHGDSIHGNEAVPNIQSGFSRDLVTFSDDFFKKTREMKGNTKILGVISANNSKDFKPTMAW